MNKSSVKITKRHSQAETIREALRMSPRLLLFFVVTVIRSQNTAYFNCAMAPTDGVHLIKLDSQSASFNVLCDKRSYGGDWTVVMNRFDGSVPFHNRSWQEYKAGFGTFSGEFFMGLDNLYALTNSAAYESLFVIVLHNNETQTSMNKAFRIADESRNYELLEVGAYSGDGGNNYDFSRRYFCSDSTSDRPGWNCGPGYGDSYIFGAYPETRDFVLLRHGHFDLCWHCTHHFHSCQLLSKLKWLIRPVTDHPIDIKRK